MFGVVYTHKILFFFFMSRHHLYCFTDFELDLSFFDKFTDDYIIMGEEECPTTKRKHWQGFIHFKNGKSISAARKALKPRHTTLCDGSAGENITYCSKDVNIVLEKGRRPAQGARNDLRAMHERIMEEPSIRPIVMSGANLQQIRHAEKILQYIEPKRDWAPEVYWYHGPTGTGKTRKAMELCEDPWVSNKSLRWWEGYDGHEDVIFDDFRRDFCTFHELLRILDRYPYRVEVKGGSRQLLAKRIFITSPYSPRETYCTREDVDQLLRRIKEVVDFAQM